MIFLFSANLFGLQYVLIHGQSSLRHGMECFPHYCPFLRGLHRSFDVYFIATLNKLFNKQSNYWLWLKKHDASFDVSVMNKSNVDILPSTSWEAHSMLRAATLPISLGPGPPVGGWGGRQSRPGGPRTPWGPVLPVPPWRPVAPVKPGDPSSEPSGPGAPGPPGNPAGPRPPWKLEDIHDGLIKWKHFPCHWCFVRGMHQSPVNSPYKGQWRGRALMFSLICAWKTVE